MFIHKKHILILAAILVIMQSGLSAFAAGEYTIPEATEDTPAATDAVQPASTAKLDAAPQKTASPSVSATSAKGSEYTLPGMENAPSSTPEADTSAAPKPSASSAATNAPLSDAEYLNSITMAFIDGIWELNPDNNSAALTVATVKVPDRRTATAQWYADGQPREDYCNNNFEIYNGRITAFELSIPFDKDTQSYETTLTFELRLGEAVKRVEKKLNIKNYDSEWYLQQDYARVFELVKPVEIEATLRNWTYTYTDSGLGTTNGGLDKGARVYYTDHAGTYAAQIWIPEEARSCWVPYYSISISNKNYTIYEDFSDRDKELFVNAKGYESTSEYLIWVNLQRQKVNTFQGSKGNWKLIRTSTCSSGKNTTLTPTGVMKYLAYENGWYHGTYYVKPVMYLNLTRGIALHSILYNPNGSVQDGTQGTPASHGCVRMPGAEIRWLADYIPVGTTVVVF